MVSDYTTIFENMQQTLFAAKDSATDLTQSVPLWPNGLSLRRKRFAGTTGGVAMRTVRRKVADFSTESDSSDPWPEGIVAKFRHRRTYLPGATEYFYTLHHGHPETPPLFDLAITHHHNDDDDEESSGPIDRPAPPESIEVEELVEHGKNELSTPPSKPLGMNHIRSVARQLRRFFPRVRNVSWMRVGTTGGEKFRNVRFRPEQFSFAAEGAEDNWPDGIHVRPISEHDANYHGATHGFTLHHGKEGPRIGRILLSLDDPRNAYVDMMDLTEGNWAQRPTRKLGVHHLRQIARQIRPMLPSSVQTVSWERLGSTGGVRGRWVVKGAMDFAADIHDPWPKGVYARPRHGTKPAHDGVFVLHHGPEEDAESIGHISVMLGHEDGKTVAHVGMLERWEPDKSWQDRPARGLGMTHIRQIARQLREQYPHVDEVQYTRWGSTGGKKGRHVAKALTDFCNCAHDQQMAATSVTSQNSPRGRNAANKFRLALSKLLARNDQAFKNLKPAHKAIAFALSDPKSKIALNKRGNVAGAVSYKSMRGYTHVDDLGSRTPGGGSRLMRHVIHDASKHDNPIGLISLPASTRFYKKLGMHTDDDAMMVLDPSRVPVARRRIAKTRRKTWGKPGNSTEFTSVYGQMFSLVYDDKEGLGATPNNDNINYMGWTVKMLPRDFVKLNPIREREHESLKDLIKSGYKVGHPSLYVEHDKVNRRFHVIGHEGRGRALSAHELEPDTPIEVHVFPLQKRAHDFNGPEILKHAIHSDERAFPPHHVQPTEIIHRGKSHVRQ